MEKEKISIFGLGLIGGSLGLELQKSKGHSAVVYGVENNEVHAKKAAELNLVQKIISREEAIANSDAILLCVPVNQIKQELKSILDQRSDIIVTDMGSTKSKIVSAVIGHKNRGRYVAAHPMAGTENTGPHAALENLFEDKAAIICDKTDSDGDALDWVVDLFDRLKMQLQFMDAVDHDKHAAYVSHVSHISSFVLAATVLEKEKSEKAMLDMASGGFESTVRLAKSSPVMWAQIFEQNEANIIEVLNTYIAKMISFKDHVENGNFAQLEAFMAAANEIKKILK